MENGGKSEPRIKTSYTRMFEELSGRESMRKAEKKPPDRWENQEELEPVE